MDFYLNLAANAFVRGVGLNAGVSAATFKARDTLTLDVYFFSGTAPTDLADDSVLVFAVKTGYEAAAETLALANTWEHVGNAGSGHYRATLSLNTEPLDEAVGDLDLIAAVGELSWSADGDNWQSSNTLAVKIVNDVYKGDEGSPDELPTPDDEWVAHGHPQSLTEEQQLQAQENINAAARPLTRTAAEGSPNGNTILAARIVGGTHDGLLLAAQGTDYGNGKELFGLDYVSAPITFINWGAFSYRFHFNTFLVATSAGGSGTNYPWEADWSAQPFDVVEDFVQLSPLTPRHIGDRCIVGDDGAGALTGNGNYLEYTSFDGETWTLTGPAGVIETDTPGSYVKATHDGTSLTYTPYDLI